MLSVRLVWEGVLKTGGDAVGGFCLRHVSAQADGWPR